MNHKLKETFYQIQAEEELKNGVRAFLAEETQGFTKLKAKKRQRYAFAAAGACLLLLLSFGQWIYFTPMAEISIDINPSIELSVNQFDRVISINSFNEEGKELSNALEFRFRHYVEVIEQILNADVITALLSDDEVMTITVIGPDGMKSSEMLSEAESCAGKRKNSYCCFAQSEEVAAAHEMGLSYGKYKAFLEIKEIDPAITPETVQSMTMKEIREITGQTSADVEESVSGNACGRGSRKCENGYGRGRGKGRN